MPDSVTASSPTLSEVTAAENRRALKNSVSTTTIIVIPQINKGEAHIVNLSTDQINALEFALRPRSMSYLWKHRNRAIASINTTDKTRRILADIR